MMTILFLASLAGTYVIYEWKMIILYHLNSTYSSKDSRYSKVNLKCVPVFANKSLPQRDGNSSRIVIRKYIGYSGRG